MFINVHQLNFRGTPALRKKISPTIALFNALHDLLGEANSPNINPCAMRLSWATVKLFPRISLPLSTATMTSDSDPYELRAKYTHFRILVIGRANAGKTTLLQRVCNTTEDPCIYDDDKNLVSVQRSEDNESWFWRFQLAWTYFSGTSLTTDI